MFLGTQAERVNTWDHVQPGVDLEYVEWRHSIRGLWIHVIPQALWVHEVPEPVS